MEHEVEVKSGYVRNVPTRLAASEIGEEYMKFGKLKPDGVAICTRKDIDVCYVFIEFEVISGVRNAIKEVLSRIWEGISIHFRGQDLLL
ncbi:hypothetical protein Pfo_015829 [Paulownia fortunei]|nr:hypothetical protein Pfo_015829 [Paulownia fortunei]